jgi:hypothetical protein
MGRGPPASSKEPAATRDRTGITGTRWNTSGAQASLRCRITAANHHDHTNRNYYNQPEHQRNHQSRHASQDNLAPTT